MFEQIGLSAILQDKAFQDGLSRYKNGVDQMERATDRGASAMSRVWAVGGAAVGVAAGAVAAGIAGIIAVSGQGLNSLNDWGNQLDALADVLGTTGEQSSTWAIAMRQTGLAVEEGAPALNFFVKQLDDLKNVQVGGAPVTAKNAEAIAGLNKRLEDANVRLERANKRLAEAKEPTDAMRFAVEDAQKAVNRLNEDLGNATRLVPRAAAELTPFQKALQTLGVRAFDAHGKLKTFDELMPDIMNGFAEMPDGVKKSALAMDLFGKSGTKFLDFLGQGSEGLEKATRLGKLYGLTISSEAVQATQDFQNALQVTRLGLQGFWVQIGAKVIPVARKFVDFFNDRLLPPLVEFAKEIAPKIGEVLDDAFNIFEDFFDLIGGRREAVDALGDDLALLTSRFGLNYEEVRKFTSGAVYGLQSVWNIGKLLASGDFTGGIFGLTEDSPFIDALLTARRAVNGIWNALQSGDASALWNAIVAALGEGKGLIERTVAEYGDAFWGWVDAAVANAQAEGGKLIAGVLGWVRDHGPETWAELQAWGLRFWGWAETAGRLAAEKVFPLVESFVNWLDINWSTQISPALAQWGSDFWTWLTGPEGVIVNVASNLEQLTGAIRIWVTKPETQQALQSVGEEIGKGIVAGIKGLFSNEETGNSFILGLLDSLSQAGRNLYESIKSAGQAIAGGFIKGIITDLTGDETKGEFAKGIFRMISDGVSKFITEGGLLGVARRMIEEFVKQLQQTMLDFHIDFSSLFTPNVGGATLPPLNFIPPTGNLGGGGSAAAALQAMPISLQVQIDGMEIKNAVVTWVTAEVNSQFGEANAATA